MNKKHVLKNITDSPILINIKDSPDIIQASELSLEESQPISDGITVITLGKDIDGNIIYSDSLKRIEDYTKPSIFTNLHQNEEITMKKKMNKRIKECLLCLLAVLLLQGILLAVFIVSYDSEIALKRILFATILLGFATCVYAVTIPLVALIKSIFCKKTNLNTGILAKSEKDFDKLLTEKASVKESLSKNHITKERRKPPKRQKPKARKNPRKRERKHKNV